MVNELISEAENLLEQENKKEAGIKLLMSLKGISKK